MNSDLGSMGNLILYEMAKKIHRMSKEERSFALERITELEKSPNRFWAKISKNMLVNEEMTNKILCEFL